MSEEVEVTERKSPKKLIIGLALFGLLSLIICGGVGFFALTYVQDMERAYYPECETAEDAESCRACCKDQGHSISIFSADLNEPGKPCGCLPD